MQNELGEKQGKWVSTIQDYDIELQPMKLVWGQALTQTMAVEGPGLVQQAYVLTNVSQEEWYSDIMSYLVDHRYPTPMNSTQKRAFRLKCQCYMLQGSILYRRNHEGIYLRCVGHDEAKRIIEHFHSKFGIGHRGSQVIALQIPRAGYYWPTVFKDAYEHVKTCHICQVAPIREKNPAMPLQPIR